MTAGQDASTRMYINQGGPDVTSILYRMAHTRMYLNFGNNAGFIVVPQLAVGLGQVLDDGATLVPLIPLASTRIYVEITA